MADIELVIKIPEWKYKSICEGIEASKRCGVVGADHDIHEAIYNGTPLPKNHGRLIDADMLKNDMQTMTEWNGDVFRCVTERTIDYSPTIIPPESEEE